MDTDDENHFEYALGFAVVRRWGDLPPEIQELLFNEATAGDDSLRQGLATFLQKSTPRRSTCSSDQQCRLETTLWNKIEVSSWFQQVEQRLSAETGSIPTAACTSQSNLSLGKTKAP